MMHYLTRGTGSVHVLTCILEMNLVMAITLFLETAMG